ncbi:unnamed protein product [Leuciscus chuanchicus]
MKIKAEIGEAASERDGEKRTDELGILQLVGFIFRRELRVCVVNAWASLPGTAHSCLFNPFRLRNNVFSDTVCSVRPAG